MEQKQDYACIATFPEFDDAPHFETVNVHYYEHEQIRIESSRTSVQSLPISATEPVAKFSYCNPVKVIHHDQVQDFPEEDNSSDDDSDTIEEKFAKLVTEYSLNEDEEDGSYLGIDTKKYFASANVIDPSNSDNDTSTENLKEEAENQDVGGSPKKIRYLDESNNESWAEYDEKSTERGVDVDSVQLRPLPGRRFREMNEELLRKSVTFDKSVTHQLVDNGDDTKVQKGLNNIKRSFNKGINRIYDIKKRDRRAQSDPFAPRRPRLDSDRVSINSNDSALSEISARLSKVKQSLEQVYTNVNPEPELLDFYFDRSEFRGTVGSYHSGDTSSLTSKTSADNYSIRSKNLCTQDDPEHYKRTKKIEKRYAGNQRKSVSDLGFQKMPMKEQFDLRRQKSMNFRNQILPVKELPDTDAKKDIQSYDVIEFNDALETTSVSKPPEDIAVETSLQVEAERKPEFRKIRRNSSGNVLSKIQRYESMENKKYSRSFNNGSISEGETKVIDRRYDLKEEVKSIKIKRSVSSVADMDLSALRDDLRSERIDGYYDGQKVFNESNRPEFPSIRTSEIKPRLRLESINYLPVGSAGLRKNEHKPHFIPVTQKYLDHLKRMNEDGDSSHKPVSDQEEEKESFYQRIYSTSGEAYAKCKSTVQNIADSGIDKIKRNLLDSGDYTDASSPPRTFGQGDVSPFLASEEFRRYSLVDSNLDDLNYDSDINDMITEKHREHNSTISANFETNLKVPGHEKNFIESCKDVESDNSTIIDDFGNSYINFSDTDGLAYPKIIVTSSNDDGNATSAEIGNRGLRKFETVACLEYNSDVPWRLKRNSSNSSLKSDVITISDRTNIVDSKNQFLIDKGCQTEDEEQTSHKREFYLQTEEKNCQTDDGLLVIETTERTCQTDDELVKSKKEDAYYHKFKDFGVMKKNLVSETSDSGDVEYDSGNPKQFAKVHHQSEDENIFLGSSTDVSLKKSCETRPSVGKKLLNRSYSTSILSDGETSSINYNPVPRVYSETESEREDRKFNLMAKSRDRSQSLDIIDSKPRPRGGRGRYRSPSIVDDFASLDSESRKRTASRLIETDQQLLNTFFERLMIGNCSNRRSSIKEKQAIVQDSQFFRDMRDGQVQANQPKLKKTDCSEKEEPPKRTQLIESKSKSQINDVIREMEHKLLCKSPKIVTPALITENSNIDQDQSNQKIISSSTDNEINRKLTDDLDKNPRKLSYKVKEKNSFKDSLNKEILSFHSNLQSTREQVGTTFLLPKNNENQEICSKSREQPNQEITRVDAQNMSDISSSSDTSSKHISNSGQQIITKTKILSSIEKRKLEYLQAVKENETNMKRAYTPPVPPRRFVSMYNSNGSSSGNRHQKTCSTGDSTENLTHVDSGNVKTSLTISSGPSKEYVIKNDNVYKRINDEYNSGMNMIYVETDIKNCIIPKNSPNMQRKLITKRPSGLEIDSQFEKSGESPPDGLVVPSLESPADSEKTISTVIHKPPPQPMNVVRQRFRKRSIGASQENISSSDEEYAKIQFHRHDRRSLPRSLKIRYKNGYIRRSSEHFAEPEAKTPEPRIFEIEITLVGRFYGFWLFWRYR